jgi:hypothetical protein
VARGVGGGFGRGIAAARAPIHLPQMMSLASSGSGSPSSLSSRYSLIIHPVATSFSLNVKLDRFPISRLWRSTTRLILPSPCQTPPPAVRDLFRPSGLVLLVLGRTGVRKYQHRCPSSEMTGANTRVRSSGAASYMSSACMYAPTPLRSNSLHTTHGRRYSFTRAVSDGWVWNTSAAAGDTGARDMAGAEGREEVGGRWPVGD